ncbi:hypothetical protein DVS77_01275 [Mycolicibacterium moriokaense]|nr:hypothetical protein DVS77_01275 [Mycolicibacterium moriokaense]
MSAPTAIAAQSPSDDAAQDTAAAEKVSRLRRRRRPRTRSILYRRTVIYCLAPLLVMALAGVVAASKWFAAAEALDDRAGPSSVKAATDATVAMLSYTPDTAEAKLTAVKGRLTGSFRDSYSSLVHDVVIPGAKQKQIASVATVPAAASISATENHAVVLLFVNQAVTMGAGAPQSTISSIRVGLDRVNGQWLISDFDPV